MKLPPKWFRRLVIDPLVFVLLALVALTLPLWLIVVAFLPPMVFAYGSRTGPPTCSLTRTATSR